MLLVGLCAVKAARGAFGFARSVPSGGARTEGIEMCNDLARLKNVVERSMNGVVGTVGFRGTIAHECDDICRTSGCV